MVRDIIVTLPTKEEIISYEYYLSGSIRATVGLGNLDAEGNFILDPTQSQQVFDIVGDDFKNLLAAKGDKPAGVFRKEDLWGYVDTKRTENRAKLTPAVEVKDAKI